MKEKIIERRRTITGSTFAKITAYFLLAISFLAGCAAAFVMAYMVSNSAYIYAYGDSEDWVEQCMKLQASNDISDFYFAKWPKKQEELQAYLEEYCQDRNIWMEVYRTYINEESVQERIAGNYEGNTSPYVYYKTYVELGDKTKLSDAQEIEYRVVLYVMPDFPQKDEYVTLYQQALTIWDCRYVFPIVTGICVLLCIIMFVFLMCAAGHKNGTEGISTGVLAPVPLEILTAIFVGAACIILCVCVEISRGFGTMWCLVFLAVACTVDVVWGTIYCAELAARMKRGVFWKHSLIYMILHLTGRVCRAFAKMASAVIKGMPLIATTALVFLGISAAEFLGLCLTGAGTETAWLWLLEKLVLVPLLLYIALVCKMLQRGSEALAKGDLSYQIDTSKMVFAFKEHGENLNQIGQGIARAVEERMKSEHLKTELITNVSHDIKTPLTSIINYSDLLGNAAGGENALTQEKVAEYSEVLLRQSKRLKKLLEDLVEASKATTGNLEVKMERCEVGVLLSQAVGEYESRFWEKQLEVIIKQPEEPVWIMADGRRLWRVFDNLLNNVCKYAQESTRVYLTVQPEEKTVQIIFRNMSKYALELSGEELEERFVRGDKSRHMEGNGLGLSIAKSLVELQNGAMEIVTDGDLFKVILSFPVLQKDTK